MLKLQFENETALYVGEGFLKTCKRVHRSTPCD